MPSRPAHRPPLPTVVRRALDVVRRQVRHHGLWQPGQGVLLACSGGRDSLTALVILDLLRPSLGHRLHIGHVDHGLWPGSGQAVDHVARHCAERGLDLTVARLDLPPGADLEARARLARYQALERMQRQRDCHVVATAHHADDQAETVLQRLGRGAGLDALAGIRTVREGGIVRPFLPLSRARLAEVAETLGLTWVEDPSNVRDDFTRNHLRHHAIPALERAIPGASQGVARTAELAASHVGALDWWIGQALGDALQVRLDGADRVAFLPESCLPPPGPALASLVVHVCRRLGASPPSTRALQQACAVLGGTRKSFASLRGLKLEPVTGGWLVRAADVAETRRAD